MTTPVSSPSGAGTLAGRVVIVTGGGSGIGAGTARLVAQRGAQVYVADRDADAAGQVAADITQAGGHADAVAVDVAHIPSCEAAFAQLRERGTIADGLVNSAGVASRAGFLDISPADWQRVIQTNLTGTMTMSQLFVRELLGANNADRPDVASPADPAARAGDDGPAGRGAVVHLASVMAHFAAPNLAPYIASKGGVAMLTRAMALELAPLGVRVNAVSPGYITTALTDRAFTLPRYRDAVLAATPMGRFGTPLDVARVIAFLLSDDAGYLTGQVLPVDGGMTAGDATLASPAPAELEAFEAQQ